MGNVAIVTDSNSGISQAEGKELEIYVIPMPFLVDGKLYFEDVDMNKEQFYHFLELWSFLHCCPRQTSLNIQILLYIKYPIFMVCSKFFSPFIYLSFCKICQRY